MEKDFDKDDVLGRWLGGSLSKAEEDALRKRPEFAEYERLLKGVDDLEPMSYQTDEPLARLKAKRAERNNLGAANVVGVYAERSQSTGAKNVKEARVRRLRPMYWAGIAASLLLVVSLWAFWPGGDLELVAAAGSTPTPTDLPDGSTVRLNAGSSVRFADEADGRVATLEGEAFFEVEKDGSTFSVNTPQGTVTVLGTSFNVYSRNGDMRVSCRTGKVRVAFTSDGSTHTLTQGMSVSLAAGSQVVASEEVAAEALDWLDGRSVFNSRPLGEVLRELERQFDLAFESSPPFDQTKVITTTFPHGSVDAALDIVLSPLDDISYVRKGQVVALKAKAQ